MRRDYGASLNDPELWALNGCSIPWEGIDEEDLITFHTPFYECLERAEGNRNLAKFLFYKQFTVRHTFATLV
jgi:hypothetical protein